MTQTQKELLTKAAEMPVDMDRLFAKHPCGTVGCLAGNIWLLTHDNTLPSNGTTGWLNVIPFARKALGLTLRQGFDLFYPDSWPNPYQKMLEAFKPNIPEYMEVVQERVLFFIDTDGTDKYSKKGETL